MKKLIYKLFSFILMFTLLFSTVNATIENTQTYIEISDTEDFLNIIDTRDWNEETEFVITDLEPGVKYHLRVKSKNGDGVETKNDEKYDATTIMATIKSDSLVNERYADVGDSVTLIFKVDENLISDDLKVKIAGIEVAKERIEKIEDNKYKAKIKLSEEYEVYNGKIPFVISFNFKYNDEEYEEYKVIETTDNSFVFFYDENSSSNISSIDEAKNLLELIKELKEIILVDELVESIIDSVIALNDLTISDIIEVIEIIGEFINEEIISEEKGHKLIEKLLEKAIELAKDNEDLEDIKEVIDNSTLPEDVKNRLKEEIFDRESLNNVVIDDTQTPPVIILDSLTSGREYRIVITDKETNGVIRTINTLGGVSIEVPEFVEGRTYIIKIDIVKIENEEIIASRIFEVTIKDLTPPEITGIYILNNQLTVLAEDNVKLHDAAYAFRIIQDGEDVEEIESSIIDHDYNSRIYILGNEGTTTINYQNENNTEIKPVKKVIVIVRDNTGNINYKTVEVKRANDNLFGDIPQDKKEQINCNNNPPKEVKESKDRDKDLTDKIIVNKELEGELKDAIEGTLKNDNLTVSVKNTEPNSQRGEISINVKKDIKELNALVEQQLGSGGSGLHYRINVIEKDTNRLVYTKLVSSAENIIIPDLQDSTLYLIQIYVVKDGEELAFRTIEKMTYDRTPPTIEQVLVKGSTIEVLAYDNYKLHDKAYQYLVDNVIRLSNNEKMDIFLVADNDVMQNLDWGSSMWTEKSRLTKLDAGAKVRVVVRDASNNFAVADVVVKDGTTYNAINSDNPMSIEKDEQIPVDELIEKVINEYNARNPKEQIKYTKNPKDYDVTTSDPSIAAIEGNRLITKQSGLVTITITDKINNKTYSYNMLVTKYTMFDRRIIVQAKSQTELLKAFEKQLYKEFLGRTITFYMENKKLGKLDDSVFIAGEDEGIVTIIATDGQVQLPLYIVIAKNKYPESDVELIISNIAYVLKIGDKINVKDVSIFYDNEINKTSTEYLITELDGETLKLNKNTIEAIKAGKGTINVIDLANNRIEIVDLIVIDFIESEFKNNENHWAKEEYDYLAAKGILTEKYEDIDLNRNVTIKDFLEMLSRTKAYCRNNPATGRVIMPFEMEKDETYYYVMDALINMNIFEIEAILGDKFRLEDDITREEVAAILALTLKFEASTERPFTDIEDANFKTQIIATFDANLMIGIGNKQFAKDNKLSYGELIKLAYNLNKYKDEVLNK